MQPLPVLITHVAAVIGVVLVGASIDLVALSLALYALRMFFITAGYHRYFAHRAFKTSRAFQLVLAVMGATAAQKGVLWWAGHHRNHHRFADTPRDLHSPVQSGFFWSHIGWIIASKYDATPVDRIRDFAKYPELRWLDRHYLVPPLLGLVGLYAAWGLPVMVWGGLVSTVLLWHGTFTINSLAHLYGTRRYDTPDNSRNNLLLALITGGEGWHNNHHRFRSSANQGFFWYEIDMTFAVLRVLEALGVVWDLRMPPASVLREPSSRSSRTLASRATETSPGAST
jgi:stearoyl-CoA desaturase (Delta-9 desaturase)